MGKFLLQIPVVGWAALSGWLAEMQRHDLGMDVGEMQQGHLTERLEAQKVGLADALGCGGRTEAGRTGGRR